MPYFTPVEVVRIHESGHALEMHLLRIPIEKIDARQMGRGARGHVRADLGRQATAHDWVKVALAGPVAEALVTGRSLESVLTEAATDLAAASQAASTIYGERNSDAIDGLLERTASELEGLMFRHRDVLTTCARAVRLAHDLVVDDECAQVVDAALRGEAWRRSFAAPTPIRRPEPRALRAPFTGLDALGTHNLSGGSRR